MDAHAALPKPLFAKVRIIAEKAGFDGVLLLHSADELGDYPATVLHDVRAWAAARTTR